MDDETIKKQAEEFARANRQLIAKEAKEPKKYEGLSDFFMHAPADEQKKVFVEAARRANEDQMKIFQEARMKVEAQ